MILPRGPGKNMYIAEGPPPGLTLEGYLEQLTKEGYGFDNLERTAPVTVDILRAHVAAEHEIVLLRTEDLERIIVATREKCEKAA